MTSSLKYTIDTALLGGGFYLLSTLPCLAYLDPGSGSMLLTAILGVLAATTYTLKGYFHRITNVFRKKRPDASDRAGQPRD